MNATFRLQDDATQRDEVGPDTARASFGRGLVFAAVASAAAPTLALGLAGWIAPGRAVHVTLLAVALAFVAWIAPDARRGVRAMALFAPLLALAFVIGAGLGGVTTPLLVVACAAGVAVARSVLFRSRSGWRGAVCEVGLQAVGLSVAAWLAAPGLLGMAAGVWGYFLIQSLFALIPGAGAPRARSAGSEAFQQACRRLERLLEA